MSAHSPKTTTVSVRLVNYTPKGSYGRVKVYECPATASICLSANLPVYRPLAGLGRWPSTPPSQLLPPPPGPSLPPGPSRGLFRYPAGGLRPRRQKFLCSHLSTTEQQSLSDIVVIATCGRITIGRREDGRRIVCKCTVIATGDGGIYCKLLTKISTKEQANVFPGPSPTTFSRSTFSCILGSLRRKVIYLEDTKKVMLILNCTTLHERVYQR